MEDFYRPQINWDKLDKLHSERLAKIDEFIRKLSSQVKLFWIQKKFINYLNISGCKILMGCPLKLGFVSHFGQ